MDSPHQSMDIRVEFTPVPAGPVSLGHDGKLQMPVLSERPGIYCFTIRQAADVEPDAYVGESDRLKRRMQHYRTPGPTQRTNIRLNGLLGAAVASGGTVAVSFVEEARCALSAEWKHLDLADKTARVLVESAWLLALKGKGIVVRNA